MRIGKEAVTGTVAPPEVRAESPTSGSVRRNSPGAQHGWRSWMGLVTRGLGALSVLAVGAVHLQQYLWLYSAVPTIGTLFVLAFTGATLIGLALLSPIERWASRWGRTLLVLVTLGGMALATVSFALLLVSENMPLFGFREPGYDPTAIAASRGAEIATVIFLGASLASLFSTKSHLRRQRHPLQATTDESRTVRLAHPTKEPLV